MTKKITLFSLSLFVLGIVFLNFAQSANALDYNECKHTLTNISNTFIEKGKNLHLTQPKEIIEETLVVDCYGSGNCNGVNCQNVDCPYLYGYTNDANNWYTHHNKEKHQYRGGHGCRNAY